MIYLQKTINLNEIQVFRKYYSLFINKIHIYIYTRYIQEYITIFFKIKYHTAPF